ncbi:twin-arginine translocation signal domain-containing protein [Epibacterium ulvae]|uniref:twin-arginine translocation signal domain-containing protein n=1 Tax=Epibacterium ulvae TaxID=1156985 RepID=UPI001BFC682B|nr:twin-arginine translocation signal domain-containing protein [Epibacterium ulvae]MBT8153173.1 twin-arginine translocation signal domain-containing protein [Epibacterium ulvae]
MSKTEDGGKSRRNFLKLAATTAPAAALAVATTGTDAQAAAEPDLSSNKMQDTAHTRAYYESIRF